MNWQGNLIIWGSLILVIVCITGGIYLPHSGYTAALLILGIIGGIVWIITAFQIAMAMGSDI